LNEKKDGEKNSSGKDKENNNCEKEEEKDRMVAEMMEWRSGST